MKDDLGRAAGMEEPVEAIVDWNNPFIIAAAVVGVAVFGMLSCKLQAFTVQLALTLAYRYQYQTVENDQEEVRRHMGQKEEKLNRLAEQVGRLRDRLGRGAMDQEPEQALSRLGSNQGHDTAGAA